MSEVWLSRSRSQIRADESIRIEVTFTASDNNSCVNTGAGQEVATATIDVFRTGVGLGNCSSSGNYNADNCYPAAIGTTTWSFSCSQNGGSCAGSSSLTSAWTCTFPMWYVTDPTDGTATSTQYWNQAWLAAVQATNYLGMASPITQGANTNTVQSFLASQLNTPAINFGSLAPGSSTVTTSATTTLSELGNVGLNETLYGANMCPTYPSCSGLPTSTIPVGRSRMPPRPFLSDQQRPCSRIRALYWPFRYRNRPRPWCRRSARRGGVSRFREQSNYPAAILVRTRSLP